MMRDEHSNLPMLHTTEKKYHAGIRLEIVNNFGLIFSLYSLVFLIFILFVLFGGRKDMNNTISFGDFREDT